MIDVESLSRKQLLLLNHANTPGFLLCAGGAIRSGKTWAATLAFAMWSIGKFPGRRFILGGQSVEAIRRNYGDDMMAMFADMGFRPKLVLSGGSRIVVPVGNRQNIYHLIGASDEKAALRLQGMTAAGALLDETVTLPESFFNQVMARLTLAGSKMWCTFNPSNPRHWFKRNVVDDLERLGGELLHFELEDNPSLPAEVRRRYRTQFSGHFHRRFIDGVWAAPSGLIFPDFTTVRADEKYRSVAIGIDWGVASVFAALMFGRTKDRTVCFDELHHDAREKMPLTEDATLEMLLAWIGKRRVAAVYLDPSAPVTFKRKLRNAGLPVRNADNDVESGIIVTSNRLSRKSIVIHERCRNLIAELLSYTWDEKKADIGEDVPLKQADHACDALRYFAYSTGKLSYAIGAVPKPQGM